VIIVCDNCIRSVVLVIVHVAVVQVLVCLQVLFFFFFLINLFHLGCPYYSKAYDPNLNKPTVLKSLTDPAKN